MGALLEGVARAQGVHGDRAAAVGLAVVGLVDAELVGVEVGVQPLDVEDRDLHPLPGVAGVVPGPALEGVHAFGGHEGVDHRRFLVGVAVARGGRVQQHAVAVGAGLGARPVPARDAVAIQRADLGQFGGEGDGEEEHPGGVIRGCGSGWGIAVGGGWVSGWRWRWSSSRSSRRPRMVLPRSWGAVGGNPSAGEARRGGTPQCPLRQYDDAQVVFRDDIHDPSYADFGARISCERDPDTDRRFAVRQLRRLVAATQYT